MDLITKEKQQDITIRTMAAYILQLEKYIKEQDARLSVLAKLRADENNANAETTRENSRLTNENDRLHMEIDKCTGKNANLAAELATWKERAKKLQDANGSAGELAAAVNGCMETMRGTGYSLRIAPQKEEGYTAIVWKQGVVKNIFEGASLAEAITKARAFVHAKKSKEK